MRKSACTCGKDHSTRETKKIAIAKHREEEEVTYSIPEPKPEASSDPYLAETWKMFAAHALAGVTAQVVDGRGFGGPYANAKYAAERADEMMDFFMDRYSVEMP